MRSERKPCPFCLSKSEIHAGPAQAWVACRKPSCGAEGPVRNTKRAAVRAWNYRPGEPEAAR
jgi:hypothetical protein